MKILSEGIIEIENPLTCRNDLRCLRNSPYGGGLGYRQYIDVTVYDLCSLWPEEMGHFLGSINSAMDYPSIIRCKIYPPVRDYKTFHDEKFLMGLFSGKGFSKVRIEGDWIIGEKV